MPRACAQLLPIRMYHRLPKEVQVYAHSKVGSPVKLGGGGRHRGDVQNGEGE